MLGTGDIIVNRTGLEVPTSWSLRPFSPLPRISLPVPKCCITEPHLGLFKCEQYAGIF